MQVCVPKEWKDKQVESFANSANLRSPDSWHIRKQRDAALMGNDERERCGDRIGFVHIMLDEGRMTLRVVDNALHDVPIDKIRKQALTIMKKSSAWRYMSDDQVEELLDLLFGKEDKSGRSINKNKSRARRK